MRLNKRLVWPLEDRWNAFKVQQLPVGISMGCRSLLAATALLATFGLTSAPALAQATASERVLAQEQTGFNTSSVRAMIARGDASVASGDLGAARQQYDKAREEAKQLQQFYRGLGGAFRGLDARIPREMDTKGREALGLLAEVNLRLAALFRRENNPKVAVPLLVEVVKLMTPTQPQGQKAYQSLLELGFVDTEFKGGSAN